MTRFKAVVADWLVAAIACLALGAIAAHDSLIPQSKTAPPHTHGLNMKGTLQA